MLNAPALEERPNVAPDVCVIGGTSTVKSRVLVAQIQALTTSPNLEEAAPPDASLNVFTSKVPALRTQRASLGRWAPPRSSWIRRRCRGYTSLPSR